MSHAIIEEFKIKQKGFESVRVKMEELLRDLLQTRDVKYHKLESRVKSFESFEEKINSNPDKYKSLNDVTDIIGFRVIAFLEDQIEPIAQLIDSEFIKDPINSIDKRRLEDDRFGYRSLHYVFSLDGNRSELPEYRKISGMKIEIQIRTILQHVWAEIEHDLGYKSEVAVPKKFRRGLNRVAALLETADLDLQSLNNSIVKYKQTVMSKTTLNFTIEEINTDSILSFIKNEQIVAKIDYQIAMETKGMMAPHTYSPTDLLVNLLNEIEIRDLSTLKEQLVLYQAALPEFGKLWASSTAIFPNGTSILYLVYIIIGKKDNIEYANKIIERNFKIRFGKELVEVFKKITTNL